MTDETCRTTDTFSDEIETLRARLAIESTRDPEDHDTVDRLMAALVCLGTDHAPMDPEPWSTLQDATVGLWTAMDPGDGTTLPRCDMVLLLVAVDAALEALGGAPPPGQGDAVDATGGLLTAIRAGLEDHRRDLRDIAAGAVELGEDLQRLLGPGQGA
jgi:hypothetical protein